jgi:sec-independent protein translocase protein TatA
MISLVEILVVGGAILLIFGSSKLPKLGRSIGESLVEFKKGLKSGMKGDPEDKKEKPDMGNETNESEE